MSLDLVLGAADLIGTSNTLPDGFWIETGAGSLPNWGSAEDIEQEIESFLQDGTDIAVVRRGNRQLTIPLRVRANSVKGLAAGIETLEAELGQHNTLTYTPSGNGSTCVFEVVTSSVEPADDDSSKVSPLRALYTLTVKALPWVRPVNLSTITWAAPPTSAPTTATVDDCTTLTKWTGSGGTLSTSGGTVYETVSNGNSAGGASITYTFSLTLSGISVSMTSTPILRVDWATKTGGPGGGVSGGVFSVKINGTVATELASSGTVHWYAMPGGATTLTSLQILCTGLTLSPGTYAQILANDVARSNASADVLAQYQTYRTLSIPGSVRTQGSIQLTDGATTKQGLGSLLVFTCPNTVPLLQPPLRASGYKTAGTETSDASAVSGKNSNLSAAAQQFQIPASLVPSGHYLILARVKATNAAAWNLTWDVCSYMGGSQIDQNLIQAGVEPQTGTGAWQIVTVGSVVLPTMQMGASGMVAVDLVGSGGSAVLDEVWLFNLDLGQLTYLECGTGNASVGGGSNGGAASCAWMDAATLDRQGPSAWIGYSSDRSDSFDAGPVKHASGDHKLPPGQVNLFTMSTGSIKMSGQISFYPRYGHRVP